MDIHHKKTSEIESDREPCNCSFHKMERRCAIQIEEAKNGYNELKIKIQRFIAVERTCSRMAKTHNTRHPDRLDMENERKRLLKELNKVTR